ncbi:MAG: trypsin-like serine protease [Planctomycetes bacterium]|nr:trypsin-like serine protease [Planctomycetota bacterium]
MRKLLVAVVLVLSGSAVAGDAPVARSPGLLVTRNRATGVVQVVTPSGRSHRGERGRLGTSTDVDVSDADAIVVGGAPSKIFGWDDRSYVARTTKFPWSCVCKIFATYPNGETYIGSGVLVGRRHILTAGHVAYDADLGGWADMEIIPGYDDGYRPFGTYTDVNATSFTGWTENADFAWDIALVELSDAAGTRAGWLGFKAPSVRALLASKLTTGGYPGDVSGGEVMVLARGKLDSVDADTIYFTRSLDIMRGQSGSGMWTGTGRSTAVVGVVSWEGESSNGGVRMSRAKYNAIAEWKRR